MFPIKDFQMQIKISTNIFQIKHIANILEINYCNFFFMKNAFKIGIVILGINLSLEGLFKYI